MSKPLSNRDAMAYVLWRWVMFMSMKEAEAVVDEMLSIVPRRIRRLAVKPYRSRKRRTRR